MPIELQARAYDQLLVFNDSASVENDGISLGFESGDRRFDPMHAVGDGRPHCARRLGRVEDATADKCPAWLVVVHICRIDDGDVESRLSRQQTGCRRDTCRAAADDDHGMLRLSHFDRRAPLVGNPANDAFHIEPGFFGRLDDVWQGLFARL